MTAAGALRVPVGDLVLDTVDTGPRDGEAVLMLHGFPQAARCWRGVWPALVDAGYRVVAPDQRGYSPGARPEGVAAYAMPRLVGDAIGLLDALGIERAHLVGHDWGAAVAWHAAAHHPDRIASLTAVSVPHPRAFSEALRTDPDQRERSQYIRLFQGEGSAEERLLADDGAYLRQAFGEMADTDAYVARMREPGALTGALNWYRAIEAESVRTMPALTVPTLYVWSDEDRALGPVPAHATASYVDAPYRFEVLHGVSHWIPEEAGDALAALLLEHLATVRT
ncbi:MAG: alpha/beta hydrolase [Frankiales bacterium]|jgi:pimeloyl-ACP methyl ester carboxylesterase|nr:alpha/beta hydrolase [Frankiales bacterium]